MTQQKSPCLPTHNPVRRDFSYVSLDESNDESELLQRKETITSIIGTLICLFTLTATLIPIFVVNDSQLRYTQLYNVTLTNDFQGWGTSLAWWAEYIGTFDKLTRMKFLDEVFNQTSPKSLKFNIVRFNIGGAPQTILENGTTPETRFGTYKGIPTIEASNRTFVWNADKWQVNIARDVLEYGVDVFEAFSNSRNPSFRDCHPYVSLIQINYF